MISAPTASKWRFAYRGEGVYCGRDGTGGRACSFAAPCAAASRKRLRFSRGCLSLRLFVSHLVHPVAEVVWIIESVADAEDGHLLAFHVQFGQIVENEIVPRRL